MLFVQSLRGFSHTKLEDTKEEHLELAVSALDRLTAKTVAWVAERRSLRGGPGPTARGRSPSPPVSPSAAASPGTSRTSARSPTR